MPIVNDPIHPDAPHVSLLGVCHALHAAALESVTGALPLLDDPARWTPKEHRMWEAVARKAWALFSAHFVPA